MKKDELIKRIEKTLNAFTPEEEYDKGYQMGQQDMLLNIKSILKLDPCDGLEIEYEIPTILKSKFLSEDHYIEFDIEFEMNSSTRYKISGNSFHTICQSEDTISFQHSVYKDFFYAPWEKCENKQSLILEHKLNYYNYNQPLYILLVVENTSLEFFADTKGELYLRINFDSRTERKI